MEPQRTLKRSPQGLAYAEAGLGRKPFSLFALFAGLLAPFAYAAIALFVAGLMTSEPNGVIAFYEMEPPIIVALVAFPFLVWACAAYLPYRGFVWGVFAGVVLIPLFSLLAFSIAFRRP